VVAPTGGGRRACRGGRWRCQHSPCHRGVRISVPLHQLHKVGVCTCRLFQHKCPLSTHPSSNPHCHHVRTEGEHCFFRGVASLPQLWKIFRPENQRSVADLQPALCRAVEEGPIITAQQISAKTPVFPPASLASSHPMPPPFPPASVGVHLELSRRRRWWHGRRYY
jgi:hypothetical protein